MAVLLSLRQKADASRVNTAFPEAELDLFRRLPPAAASPMAPGISEGSGRQSTLPLALAPKFSAALSTVASPTRDEHEGSGGDDALDFDEETPARGDLSKADAVKWVRHAVEAEGDPMKQNELTYR